MPAVEVSQLLIGIGALLLVAPLADLVPKTRAGQIIERTGVPLAAFSYTLYLTHYPVLWSLATCSEPMPVMLDGPSTGRFLLWLAVCLAAALGMSALFESRTPRVRRWLRAQFGGGSTRAKTARDQPPLAVEA